ncbi:MAG: succinate dehydrogenase/fumarate reductase iron-sulfur subunit [Methanobacterium sp.]
MIKVNPKIKVYRFNHEMESPDYDTFEVELHPGMTVLSALFQIQDKYDDSLAFRYSCRGAVCGTCAMLINKVPRLACRSQVEDLLKDKVPETVADEDISMAGEDISWNPQEEVLVEPLPHLPVIRDLVVDMELFFQYYRLVEPTFRPAGPDPEKERLMDPGAVKELGVYTNCILCGACHAACPVVGENPEYLGPAALAKLYRFYIDPREAEGDSRLEKGDIPNGWWACESYGDCYRVCPRNVPPIVAIRQAINQLNKWK